MEANASDNSGNSAGENFGMNVGTNVIVTRISELVAPIVSDLGLDLYDLEFVSGVVRVVVDTKPGTLGENGRPAGVDLEKIGLLTRLISKEFDHAEPVPGRYTLEVTSPGL
ncbi:MAG: ribosome maturation factor RimP, partial [Actinomycetota bacterium]